jgi:hypothetical protein
MAVLARVPPDQRKATNAHPSTTHTSPVWLVREPIFSPLDPIEVFLSSLGPVKVYDALPVPGEIAGHRALVVVSRATTGPYNPIEVKQIADTWPEGNPAVFWMAAETDKNDGVHKWPIRVGDFAAAIDIKAAPAQEIPVR